MSFFFSDFSEYWIMFSNKFLFSSYFSSHTLTQRSHAVRFDHVNLWDWKNRIYSNLLRVWESRERGNSHIKTWFGRLKLKTWTLIRVITWYNNRMQFFTIKSTKFLVCIFYAYFFSRIWWSIWLGTYYLVYQLKNKSRFYNFKIFL